MARFLEQSRQYRVAADFYHFAGHHLRSVESFKNAAIAYREAGSVAERAAANSTDSNNTVDSLTWAVRGYARAKVCFSDVGEAEEAARAYVAEQDARQKLARVQGETLSSLALIILRFTSMYGQSWWRLGRTIVAIFIAYTVAYEFLNYWGLVTLSSGRWHSGLSGAYYALAIPLSLDASVFQSSPMILQWIALSNLALGWAFLGLAAAMVARRVKER